MTRTHLVAALAVVLSLVAPAAPATAREVTLEDARGDVWREPDATTASPAPSVRSGDVTKAVVGHDGRRAFVEITFARLARTGSYAQYAVRFQGRNGVVREVLLESSRRMRSGGLRVFNAKGRPVDRCDVDHDIDYRRDEVTVEVDRRCLHRPGKVRVNVNTARATRRGVFFSDTLHDATAASTAWTDWVKRSR